MEDVFDLGVVVLVGGVAEEEFHAFVLLFLGDDARGTGRGGEDGGFVVGEGERRWGGGGRGRLDGEFAGFYGLSAVIGVH